jgi:hypothetical protein
MLSEATDALRTAAAPDEIVTSSLSGFASALRRAAAEWPLPIIDGELRDSYGYTWTLQGTFATRAYQKRANAHAERLLLREAEPWSTIAWARGAFSRRHLVEAAWATLLSCHPHDTLCGCSIDGVARAMDDRLDDALTQGIGIRDDALFDIVGHDPVAARPARARWREVVLVRNSVPRRRSGIAELEIRRFLTDVPVGPGSGHSPPPPRLRLPPPELDGGRIPLQVLDRAVANDRIESPRHYPDNDLVEVTRVVAWLPAIAGYGTATFTLDGPPVTPSESPVTVRATRNVLDNGALTVAIDDAGNVGIASVAHGSRIGAVVRFEDVPDVGDLYTHAPGAHGVTHASFLGAHVVQRGPLRGTIEGRWRVRIPPSAAVEHERVALTGYSTPATSVPALGNGTLVALEMTVRLTLDAGASTVGVTIVGENVARDHRLRVVFATGLPHAVVWADAAFGPVQRRSIAATASERAMEIPPATAPLHRYVSLFSNDRGVTLYSDGLAEYEALTDGGIAVTLVRAVGELSRNDLPERPGHAGWPVPTPLAQCLGPFEASFALMLHGPRSPATIHLIERAADDVLIPLRGSTLRSALAVSEPTGGIELFGDGLAFGAVKESEDGATLVLRCVNLTDSRVDGRWRLQVPASDARLARLDETPLTPLHIEAGDIPFTAAPRAVVTILVR